MLMETRQDDNKGHYHCWFLCNFQVTRCKSIHYPISYTVLYTIYYASHKPASSSELVFTYFMLSKYLCVPSTHHKYNIFYALFYSLFPLRKKFWNLLISIYTSHILRVRINGPRLAINFDYFMEHFLLILIKFADQLINHLTHFYFCNKALFDTLT